MKSKKEEERKEEKKKRKKEENRKKVWISIGFYGLFWILVLISMDLYGEKNQTINPFLMNLDLK